MSAISERVRKALIVAVTVVALGGIALAITRWYIYRSEPYNVAVGFLKASRQLAAITGTVRSARLSWLEASSVEEVTINGKPSGDAEFTVVTEGDSATVPVEVKMVRDARGWRVTQALAGGESLKLVQD